jgi:hypothetical protein
VFVRTGYHTQVPEISSKLNGKKSAFTWATSLLPAEPGCRAAEKKSIIICALNFIQLTTEILGAGLVD